MLLLVSIALIGAVVSEPQGVIPMGYNIVAPQVAPSMFPISYSTIPASTVPSAIPAIIPGTIPGPISGPIPAESVPATTISLGSIPAGSIPMGSIPAGIPLGSIPPASLAPAAIPAAPGFIQMGQNIIYPSLDISMAGASSIPKPVEDTPEVKKARMDFETAYNKALSGTTAESTSLFRTKRDLQRVMPYGYNLPYSGYVTPYGQIAGAVPSSHVIPSNVLHSPYSNVLSSNVIPSNVLPAPYYAHV
ncbi:hypothetical protein GE061_012815 [Apolygus lucorum]|uniref:Uncharacterized protein n=1 Tax=Apolygus lucorum TaxID=248454 RepID=A0A6A4JR74_APOLU|nr:hypothetical protein GE061_012815 [Apolygus lucorum]